jgi:hypothetical protein
MLPDGIIVMADAKILIAAAAKSRGKSVLRSRNENKKGL